MQRCARPSAASHARIGCRCESSGPERVCGGPRRRGVATRPVSEVAGLPEKEAVAFLHRVRVVLSILLAVGACGEPLPLAQEDDMRWRSGPAPMPLRYIGVLPWP